MSNCNIKQLNIAQWNAQSLLCNQHIFTHFLYEKSIHIAIVSETWLKPSQSLNIKNYNIERNDCGNTHNGVAIVIHKNIPYEKITTQFDNSLQNIVVSIKINNKLISIVSIYCPTHSIPSFTKTKFDDLITSIPKPVFISGDFNAHHTIWGCNSVDSRGRDILDSIDDNELVLLNNGQVTTVGSMSWRPNALDLTMVSSSLALSCEWWVHDDPLGSYHLPTMTNLTFNINNMHTNYNNYKANINFKLVNWELYNINVNNLLKQYVYSPNNPLESYYKFFGITSSAIKLSYCKYSPTTSNVNSNCNINRKIKHPSVPWWNDKCSAAVKNSKDAYKAFKLNPTNETYISFKRLQALKKLVLKRERSDSWKEFCCNINRTTPMTNIWQTMRKFNKKYKYSINNIDPDPPWINNFLQKYTCSNETPLNIQNYIPVNSNNSYLIKPFTIQELNSALKTHKNTACGLDSISYKMLSTLNTKNIIIFLEILNALWELSIIPKDWKTDCLIPILKPDKEINNEDLYRPIALTSCVSKIFEKLIKHRLEFYIESNSILPSNQFGFRRGLSARESLSHLFLDIHSARNNNNHLICIFIDIEGAFNNVNISVLSSTLASIGIPEKIVKWIYNFLNGREVYVKHNNRLHGSRLSYKGVCQGGILSPLLYILYVYQLNKKLGPSVNNLQYADDLAIYCTGNNIKDTSNKLNLALKQLLLYFKHLKLEVNTNKSKVVIFNKKKTTACKLYYNNHCLPIESSTKFLGVQFQWNFIWNKYVDCLIERAMKATNILRSLVGTKWGADPKILLILYKSLVRSHFDYAFFCYASEHKFIEKVEKVQNKNLRLILGAMKTSPINSMQIECNLPPLKIRFEFLKYKFITKLLAVSNNPLLEKLSILSSTTYLHENLSEIIKFKDEFNIYNHNNWPCYLGSYNSKFCNIKIVIDKTLRNKFDVYNKLTTWPDHKHLYTDGSKTEDSVSMVMYNPENNIGHGFKLPKISSIYTAEANAILMALNYIENNTNMEKWIIITDSMSVLTALSNPKLTADTPNYIYEIREKYSSIKNEVILFWTPSHTGVAGNEKADNFAKTITTIQCAPVKNIKLPYTELNSELKHIMKFKWNENWKTTLEHKGKWYNLINKNISTPWYTKGNYINRKYYSTICRLRLGHGTFNEHLHRMKIISSPLCTFCNSDPQSLHHIFFNCPIFNIQRMLLIDKLLKVYQKAEKIPRSLQELLMNRESYQALYVYICTTVQNI